MVVEIYRVIDIDSLMIDTTQSRLGGWDGDEQDERLIESVAQDGIMSPLIVRPVSEAGYDADEADGEYSIIAGSRRYNAAIENGFDEVPCRVIEAADFEAAVKSFKENEERKDLTDEERMRSLRMQYEMIAPEDDSPPYECKDCDEGPFKSLKGHVAKEGNGCEMISLDSIQNQDRRAQTAKQAYKALADLYYPDMSMNIGVQNIKNQIKAVELPEVLQLLLKDKNERSFEERDKLRSVGLKGLRDMSASVNAENDLSAAFNTLVTLYETVDETDGINADTAVVKAVGELDFNQTNSQLRNELSKVNQEFKMAASETRTADVEREFWSVVDRRKGNLRELHEEIGLDSLGKFSFTFEEQKYRRYHALARENLREEDNATLVKTGYQEWLEEQARKHGW